MPVLQCDPEEAKARLNHAGISTEAGNTEYEQWRAVTDEATAVAYEDKVVIQGSNPVILMGLLNPQGGRASVYFDGASRGNPGPAAIGWVVATDDGIVTEGGEQIGHATNNEAEYRALLAGIEAATAYGFHEVHVQGDSELIVKQITGEYTVNALHLQELRVEAYELLESFDSWTITYIPREANERADALANDAFEE